MLVHSELLRWLARPLLPEGWVAGSFQTAGEVDAQRVALELLGTRLAVLSIVSFLFKCVSAAIAYFARDLGEQSESIIFLATVLTVQAVPSSVTLLLLHRYHFGGSSSVHGSLMQPLLRHDGAARAAVFEGDAAAASQGRQVASGGGRSCAATGGVSKSDADVNIADDDMLLMLGIAQRK